MFDCAHAAPRRSANVDVELPAHETSTQRIHHLGSDRDRHAGYGTGPTFRCPIGWRAMRRLNPLGVAGVVLLVLGLAALAYQGISYTSRETVIDLGPIHATAERQRTLPLPPIFGIAAVAAGVVLLMTGVRRPTT